MPAPPADPPTPPQVIPRPATARPGDPAPWAGLPAAARRHLSLERVLRALDGVGQTGAVPAPGGGLPGPWVEVFDTAAAPTGIVSSAVLVALFPDGGQARVVLTRRSRALRSHRGEVSFPGGRIDPGEDAPAAARREALEEVALDPSAVDVVGWLHPVLTFSSGSLIQPVVASLPGRPSLVASPHEVERVFDVSLAELAADGVFSEERWSVAGRPVPGSEDGSYPVWFFAVAGEIVWGATARMLYELLAVALGVGRPPG